MVFLRVFLLRGAVYNASNRRICSFECFKNCLQYLIFTWSYNDALKGKYSRFAHAIKYLRTEGFSVSSNHKKL